jgi:hypothetical protein
VGVIAAPPTPLRSTPHLRDLSVIVKFWRGAIKEQIHQPPKDFNQKRMPYPQEVEAAKDFQTQQQQQQ